MGYLGSSLFGKDANELWNALSSDEIQPGAQPEYELCKLIYTCHPLGHKIAALPVDMALREKPEYSIDTEANDDVVDEFKRVWDEMECDQIISQCAIMARVYGIASIVIGAEDKEGKLVPSDRILTPSELADYRIYLNVYDPLPTSGSLTINQDPSSPNFMKAPSLITVLGQQYTRGRFCLLMNQAPTYLAWTESAYGYTGRAAFAQIVYDLGTYLKLLKATRMAADKVGVLVAKYRQPSSTTDQVQASSINYDADLLKRARTGEVYVIDQDDSIESLNLQNLDSVLQTTIKANINAIADGCGMPNAMLNSESYAHGFSGGDQDAMRVAGYLMERRKWMMPLFQFLQPNVMRRAWNKDFIATMRNRDPEQYGDKSDESIFQEWRENFHMEWPSLIEETESDKKKAAQQVYENVLKTWNTFTEFLGKENKEQLLDWCMASINNSGLFASELVLNPDDGLLSPDDNNKEEGEEEEEPSDMDVLKFMKG